MFKNIKKIMIKSVALMLTDGLNLYRKFRPLPPRIYFCYNQSLHHIYHSLFVAIELSNIQDTYEVVVLSTSKEASVIIKSELNTIPNRIIFQPVYHPGYSKKDFNIGWFAFFCLLRMHRPAAVVVTDYYDNVFRQLRLKTFWVYLPHGLLNREFGSHPHIREYDLAIIPGARDLQEFQQRLGLLPQAVIAGYSKLDYLHYHQLQPPALFREKKPVILYNPHFEPQFSSFFDQGRQLMEALAATGKYNLIFLPHPDLAGKHPREVQELKKLPHTVVIDRPRINLDYLAAADVYITDVSSSVFEWLYFDKPALFFNTKNVDWRQDRYYSSWILGRVARTIPEMLAAIEEALLPGDDFRATRTRILHECFANREQPVSRMIAGLILARIKADKQIPQLFYSGEMGEHTGYGQAFSFLARSINKERPIRIICRRAQLQDFHGRISDIVQVDIYLLKKVLLLTPLRWSLKIMTLLEHGLFDYRASRRVIESTPVYANQGQALYIFKQAAAMKLERILIAHTPHIDFVWQIHRQEQTILGQDLEWLHPLLRRKIRREYEGAHKIIVFSQFSYDTFKDNGIAETKLIRWSLDIDRDYFKREQPKKDRIFRVLYVGRLMPEKGVHYLIKAFQELAWPGIELLLFGGTLTRSARTWLGRQIKGWGNIRIASGDPRPAYEQSSVLVNPALQDGYGLTVAEAMVYGLPVIVTENTGAKEIVQAGQNGFVIPVRDVQAIKEKLTYYYQKHEKTN
jgi:glycosyltransferase involved in cell wall biosynthesis